MLSETRIEPVASLSNRTGCEPNKASMAIPLSTGSNALRWLYSAAEKRDEEIRRRDHLLAAALERIPALEAPPDTTLSEPRGSRETASEEAAKGTRLSESSRSPHRRRGSG